MNINNFRGAFDLQPFQDINVDVSFVFGKSFQWDTTAKKVLYTGAGQVVSLVTIQLDPVKLTMRDLLARNAGGHVVFELYQDGLLWPGDRVSIAEIK